MKAQQEERLDEINKVRGGTKEVGLGLRLGEEARTEGLPWLWLSPQQFLDDPKYNSDKDLLYKLEAFKSEGKTVGMDGGEGVGFLQKEKGRGETQCCCAWKKEDCLHCPGCIPFPGQPLAAVPSVQDAFTGHFNPTPASST